MFIFIDFIKEREEYLVRRLFDQINVMFDPMVFDEMNVYDIEFVYPSGNPKLKTKDKDVINLFLSNLHYVKTVNVGQLGLFKRHQKKAKEILNFIKQEYPDVAAEKRK